MNEAERHSIALGCDASHVTKWEVTRPASQTGRPNKMKKIRRSSKNNANWDVTRPASQTDDTTQSTNNSDARRAASQIPSQTDDTTLCTNNSDARRAASQIPSQTDDTTQSTNNNDAGRAVSQIPSHIDDTIKSTNNSDARRAASQIAVRRFFSPFYDPDEKIVLSHGHLPHWHQFEKIQFVTFHLADSIPQTQLSKLKIKIKQWQERHPKPWKKDEEEEYYSIFGKKIDEYLDAGYGNCYLKIPEVRTIVKEALFYFHGQRYQLLAFVIMSNHVHVLLVPFEEYLLGDILHSWKSFTAHKINRILGKNGSVWHKESFDRIIRNENHLQKVLAYIRQNAEYGPCSPDTYWEADPMQDSPPIETGM